MELGYFLRGVILGFSIAAPVGPIGVLCIRRTLAEGRLAGLVSGLGAATADAIYGFIAAFGLTFISSLLIDHQVWISLIGGLFLLYLGVKTLLAPVADRPATASAHNLLADYTSTLFLTLTNPLTILSFVAVFAGLGVGGARGDYAAAAATVVGVFTGSALWWLTLSTLVSVLRSRFSPRALVWVNRISGVVILSFGVAALFSLAGQA
jgi:threonine/homoserine/homoserine lactone efflux protein